MFARYPALNRLALVALLALAPSLAHADSSSSLFKSHQADAVNWRIWSPEIVAEAETSSKPVFFFVSHFGNNLGKAMLRETFSNQTIADELNAGFIPVLVDVNEQPELASFLARLAQEHFQASGWPTCLWTRARLAPLTGGGYFPPTDDWGSQGFLSVTRNVAVQWEESRDEVVERAGSRLKSSLQTSSLELSDDELMRVLASAVSGNPDAPALSAAHFLSATQALTRLPQDQTSDLQVALETKLRQIISNAGFDPISGGFFIGSNDPNWRLPLFQKSASDQALMMRAVALLNQRNPKSEYADVLRLTATFIENDLLKSNGLARQYLDSHAHNEASDALEGSYYLLREKDLDHLPDETLERWSLNRKGNLDANTDILGLYTATNIARPSDVSVLSENYDEARSSLQTIRNKKPKPVSNDTGYTATQALIAQGLTAAYQSTGNQDFLQSAKKQLAAILQHCRDGSGVLYNSDAKDRPASSQSYSFLIAAALDLYEVTQDEAYVSTAWKTLEAWHADPRFEDENSIALATPRLAFPVSIYQDSSLPSVASVQIENLTRLARIAPESKPAKGVSEILSQVPKQAALSNESYLALYLASIQAKN